MFVSTIDSSPEDAMVDDQTVPWATLGPDAMLALLLEQVAVEADSGGAVDPFDDLERIEAWEKLIAWAQAQQCAEIARFVGEAEASPDHGMAAERAVESAQAEVGFLLTLSAGSAAWRVAAARRLVGEFPATFAALQSGAITLVKARIIADGCADLSPESAAAVEARVLPHASQQTNGQLRAAVARAVKREDAEAAERRRQRKQRDRAVVLYPQRDGMATLSATLPAAEAVGVFAVLDQHARSCGSVDGRSMDARRADALVDLVLRDTGFCSTGARPVVPDPSDGPSGTSGAASGTETPPAAPASSRLPGITPEGGVRTVTNTVSIQVRVIVPLGSLRAPATNPPNWRGTGRSPPPRLVSWPRTPRVPGGGWSSTRSPVGSSISAPPATGPHPTWPNG